MGSCLQGAGLEDGRVTKNGKGMGVLNMGLLMSFDFEVMNICYSDFKN